VAQPPPGGRRLIPAARRARVLELVRREGAASLHGLAASVGVSLATTRRDLDYLTRGGYLERTHGGALLRPRVRTTFEPAAEITAEVALPAKRAIGRRAAAAIEDGQSVILDSSSTVLEAARTLVERDLAITVVTNDLRIAIALSGSPRVQLMLAGGLVRPGSFTLTGAAAQSFVQGLRADIALIGIHSLAGARPSETSIEVALMKRNLIAAAGRVLLLADSSKFEHPAFCEVCPIRAISEVITDSDIRKADHAALVRAGVAVTKVAVDALGA
jgi:DeoR/GlpR family transcriptional regulator of sugar metabolism